MLLTWFRLLDQAATTDEVLAITREFFATWAPQDVARLAVDCRPGRMKSEADLEALHSCVAEEYRRTKVDGENRAAMQRLTSFVVRASIRMAQIREEHREDLPDQSPRSLSRRALAR